MFLKGFLNTQNSQIDTKMLEKIINISNALLESFHIIVLRIV